MLTLRQLSSLVKVLPEREPQGDYRTATMLCGERFSYQVAFNAGEALLRDVQVTARCETLAAHLSVRYVGWAVCDMPVYPTHDDYIVRGAPGLMPDPLFELPECGIIIPPNQWRAVWIEIDGARALPVGKHDITVRFTRTDGESVGETTFALTVLDACLPAQTLIYTNWFHTDCLSSYYGVPVFGERYWQLVRAYLQTAVKRGMNMVLTPVFTPALDTRVDGERITVQLVDIEKDASGYHFDFTNLRKWFDMCLEEGIQYFEICHLFTQWGLAAAPKIMVREGGTLRRMFGWDTPATGEAYVGFLRAFLPALTDYLRAQGFAERCWFHLSDEPSEQALPRYLECKAIVKPLLEGFRLMDALSDYAFYESGAVEHPIPANDHIEPFALHDVPGLWTYYCCGQFMRVPNRFLDMPSARNRVLGMLMYKYKIAGFLQWGYNFYNSMLSRYAVNPYVTTSADGMVPSGDAFIVYPGQDAPIESLRLLVFEHALQDMRALQALEARVGRERVIALLEQDLAAPLTMAEYPHCDQWLLDKREQINALLAQ